ncbi:MAG: hypothetical protein AB7K52_05160 [Phycisphaerales bacterium]
MADDRSNLAPPGSIHMVLAWTLFLFLALAWPVPARAQVDPASVTGATGEVDLRIIQFGVGDVCRAGELTGIQLEVQDRMTRPRGILLRLAVPDPSGDFAFIQTSVAANPGQKQRPWVYARVPFNLGANPVFEVRAYEEIVGDDGAQTGRPGKLLGTYTHRVQGPSMAPAYSGLLAVVGRQLVNLDLYRVRDPSGMNCSPFGHEAVHDIAQLRTGSQGVVGELPDRWYGLQQFEAIVWTAGGAEGAPTDLTPGQAEAIIEWVERGGHFVVVLPPAGQTWIGSTDNPLASIMPRVAVRRAEGVSLEPLRPLLLGNPRTTGSRRLPDGQILQMFTPDPRAEPGQAIRLLTTPGTDCIVTRRIVGIGAVTVIGVDLTSRQLLQAGGVATDVFWHRVLGKRGVLISAGELAKATQTFGSTINNRGPRAYDAGIKSLISKTAAATAGLLLAFVLFVAYWILAGPLGFAALRRKHLGHHSWLSFVLIGAAFTGVAWGGATVLRPLSISAVHVTFLDHVFGQDTQRARSFVSVLLPRYGSMSMSVADTDPGARFHNSLFAWDEPLDRPMPPQSYPDARGYVQDGRHPAAADFPARYTTKEVQIDWAGGPRWRMISPVTPAASGPPAPGGRIELLDPSLKQGLLRGTLVHELPVALKDVVILLVEGQDLSRDTSGTLSTRTGTPTRPGAIPAYVHAFSRAEPWSPGEFLDLSAATTTDLGTNTRGENYLEKLVPPMSMYERQALDAGQVGSTSSIPQQLTALAFFSMLDPPDFSRSMGFESSAALARRQATHGLDLSRWFTEPCVIIVGHLGDEETEGTCPVPLLVDVPEEERANATPLRKISGRTIVRWVYPLPDRPTAYPKGDEPDPATPNP